MARDVEHVFGNVARPTDGLKPDVRAAVAQTGSTRPPNRLAALPNAAETCPVAPTRSRQGYTGRPRACGGIGRRARLRALWTEWSVEVRVLSGALGKPRVAGLFCCPGRVRASVRAWTYWSLTGATSVKDRKLRFQVVILKLEHGCYEVGRPLPRRRHRRARRAPALPARLGERWRSTNLLERSPREFPPPHQGDLAGSPPRPAASRSSGRCSTFSSATPGTARRSPTSTANTFTESSTTKPTQTRSTRRSPPHRLALGT